MIRAALATAAALAAAAVAAAATTPFPSQRAGSGTEPTAGGGVFAGSAFRPASAVVHWDPFLERLALYLVRRPFVGCANWRQIVNGPGRLVQVGIVRKPVRLAVGKPIAKPIIQYVSRPSASGAAQIVPFLDNVRLVLTRVDTSRGATWHGRLHMPDRVFRGVRYSYDGTFAALWCRGG